MTKEKRPFTQWLSFCPWPRSSFHFVREPNDRHVFSLLRALWLTTPIRHRIASNRRTILTHVLSVMPTFQQTDPDYDTFFAMSDSDPLPLHPVIHSILKSSSLFPFAPATIARLQKVHAYYADFPDRELQEACVDSEFELPLEEVAKGTLRESDLIARLDAVEPLMGTALVASSVHIHTLPAHACIDPMLARTHSLSVCLCC